MAMGSGNGSVGGGVGDDPAVRVGTGVRRAGGDAGGANDAHAACAVAGGRLGDRGRSDSVTLPAVHAVGDTGRPGTGGVECTERDPFAAVVGLGAELWAGAGVGCAGSRLGSTARLRRRLAAAGLGWRDVGGDVPAATTATPAEPGARGAAGIAGGAGVVAGGTTTGRSPQTGVVARAGGDFLRADAGLSGVDDAAGGAGRRTVVLPERGGVGHAGVAARRGPA